MVSEEKDIHESLHILLSTRPGERIMLPEFGCDIKSMVFEVVDSSNISLMKNMIKNAILFFEPRITLEDIDIQFADELGGKLLIDIQYTIRKTNTRSNMVFPYYIAEGTEVKYLSG